MPHADNSNSEGFIRVIQVLADDKDLRMWFFSLRPMTDSLRRVILERMVEEMKANDEDTELVAFIQSLMDPLVYEAALTAMAKYWK